MHRPLFPAELQLIIDTHRAEFGGFTMMADEKPETGDTGQPNDNTQKDGGRDGRADGFKSEESKQRLLDDLADERGRRQALEQKVGPMEATLSKLAEAFAPDSGKDAKDDTSDVLDKITARLDKADLVAEVERLARTNHITEDDDVQLLMAVKDKEQREALAKRLAPAAGDNVQQRRQALRPDPSAGRGGDDDSRRRAGSVAQAAEDYRKRHNITN